MKVVGRGAAILGVLMLAACSGGEPASIGSGQNPSPLVSNAAYPNVSQDVAQRQSGVKSSSEVKDIEKRMMSLAAEQDSAARQQPASVVNDMQALAARNRKLADDELEAQANGN